MDRAAETVREFSFSSRQTSKSVLTARCGVMPSFELKERNREFSQKALRGMREPFSIPEEFPRMKEVLSAIPEECFHRSYFKSFMYLLFSLAATLATAVLACHVLPCPSFWPLSLALWTAFALVEGTIATGLWVVAHECGHGAFCDNKPIQTAVGFVLHSALLVPYFSWQRSHAVHHSRTNHITEGETHVPKTLDTPEGEQTLELLDYYGEDAFAVLSLVGHLIFGWPAYLTWGVTGGPARGSTCHFIPYNYQLFPNTWHMYVWISDLGLLGTLLVLLGCCIKFGTASVVALYFGPYLVVNAWLVTYTWLQHTDVDIPHYGASEWTWVKGAFCTVDRAYPPLVDFLHHGIGTTHVAHHLCSRIPHYNARKATEAIKKVFPEYYLYDPTPIWLALWRIAGKCVVTAREQNKWFFTEKDMLSKTNKKAQ